MFRFWTWPRVGIALAIAAAFLVSTEIEEWLASPGWLSWTIDGLILGSWLILGRMKRFGPKRAKAPAKSDLAEG